MNQLLIVKFTERHTKSVCYNLSENREVFSLCDAKRYNKRELDEAIKSGETWVNIGWDTEYVLLDEWR